MKDKRIYGMFGPKIKAMRLEQGLKQRQLAELLGANRAQMIPMFTLSEYRSFTVVKGAAGHVAGGTFKKRDFTSR